MSLLPFPEENLPLPGRVLRGQAAEFLPAVFTQLSLSQGLKNSYGTTGENFLWTSQIDVELPIRLLDDGEFGAVPPRTIVETFAAAARAYGDKPAIAWKSVKISSLAKSVSSGLQRTIVIISCLVFFAFLVICTDDVIDNMLKHLNCLLPLSILMLFSITVDICCCCCCRTQEEETEAASAAEPDPSNKPSPPKNNVEPDPSYKPSPPKNNVGHNNFPPRDPPAKKANSPIIKVLAVDNKWSTLSWQAYWSDVCFFAKSLLAAGHGPRERVAVMGFNAPEFAIAYFGTIFANGIPASIYATNNADAVGHVVRHAETKIAVCDTLHNLAKFVQSKELFPALETIIVYGESIPEGSASMGIISWDAFMSRGRHVADRRLAERMEAQRPGMCSQLMYTSGTTGPPKGVMLSHDNMLWTGSIVVKMMHFTTADCVVSFLPLSHVAPQMIDLYLPLLSGMTTYFARPDALQGSLLETIQEVRPTWFFAVPRVWEKMEEKIRHFATATTGLRRKLFDFALRVGFEGTMSLLEGKPPPVGYGIAKRLVHNKVKHSVGLDRCKGFASGAAPITRVTQEFFVSLGMPICDLFGMTECSGPQNCNVPYPGWFRLRSSGQGLPATELRIANPSENGEGEVCFRGRNVFLGYYNDAEASKKAFDEFGFLHSGDLGFVDEAGFLFITGRLKELLVTAGGENVPPLLIEGVVKEELPFVSQCQVVGDRRKYLTILICLKSVPDECGQPTTNLTPSLVALLREKGSEARTTHDAQKDQALAAIINQGIERANRRAISRAQMIQAWRIVPNDFSLQGGELTPTLKLKRNFVIKKYEQLIDSMYPQQPNEVVAPNAHFNMRARL